MDLFFEYSAWWLLPIALLSLLFSGWQYYKNPAFSSFQNWCIGALRFFSLFAMGFLFLSPTWQIKSEVTEKPIVVFLRDNTASLIKAQDSAKMVLALANLGQQVGALNDKYEVVYKDFDRDLRIPSDSFSYLGSNIEKALMEVREMYYGQNLSHVLLASDGIYNLGNDPAYLATEFPVPIHTVLLGDSTLNQGIAISKVNLNNTTYKGNEFPVEIQVSAQGLLNQSFGLQIIDENDKVLISETRTIDQEEYFISSIYYLLAQEEGIRRFKVQIVPLTNQSFELVQREFSIEVISRPKQIQLWSRGPHPDINALVNAISNSVQYQLLNPTPELRASKEVDLFILHDPTDIIIEQVIASNTPYWIIWGANTSSRMLKSINAGGSGYELVEGSLNLSFELFDVSAETEEWLKDVPPLWSTFGEAMIATEYSSLLYKKIRGVKTTEPLWIFRSQNLEQNAELRSSVTFGAGIWQWRMLDYKKHKDHLLFDNLVLNTLQYLTTGNEQNQFVVDLPDRVDYGTKIKGSARLFNKAMQLVNTPEVEISLLSESEEEYTFNFNRVRNAYRLNISSLKPGYYKWTAKTVLNGEEFSYNGKLFIQENKMELNDLVARPGVLRKIARESGGISSSITNFDQTLNFINEDKSTSALVSYVSEDKKLTEMIWPFVVILILASAEWVLRKYLGKY